MPSSPILTRPHRRATCLKALSKPEPEPLTEPAVEGNNPDPAARCPIGGDRASSLNTAPPGNCNYVCDRSCECDCSRDIRGTKSCECDRSFNIRGTKSKAGPDRSPDIRCDCSPNIRGTEARLTLSDRVCISMGRT